MEIIYIAHPIGGNIEVNMASVQAIVDQLFTSRPQIYPIAPYLYALRRLNDNKPDDRLRGTSINKLYFDRQFIDEVWLFGNRVSAGMWEEVQWARKLGIPVVPINHHVQLSLIRKELKPGDEFKIIGCGPGQVGVVTYLGELRNHKGIWVRNRHNNVLDLWWGDIIHMGPIHGATPACYLPDPL
jgi:hypothetical protein